jgi:hypothetical protein
LIAVLTEVAAAGEVEYQEAVRLLGIQKQKTN